MAPKILMLFCALTAGLAHAEIIPLDAAKVKLTNVKAESANWKGRACLRVTDSAGNAPDGDRYAIVPGTEFQDGTIELDLTGDTLPTAPPAARGFTGLAFRLMPDGKYESFYLRPKNGRAEDQEQRNHSTQYISNPEFPWQKLRQETPSKYESYVDLVPGEWSHIKIEVHGDKARLYVNGAQQPTLIVKDLKHGASKGAIALWVGPGTVAHFANLKVTR